MTKLTLTEQEELFAKDCKLINLRYEYTNYTGKEKWAVVTELTEKELRDKYPDIIKRYTPFVLLSVAQGKVITEYQNIEAKERMRKLRTGHIFDVNDGEFEEHHPELTIEPDFVAEYERKEKYRQLYAALSILTQKQKQRVYKYFFCGKSYAEISREEKVDLTTVKETIEASIKKLEKFLKNTPIFSPPSSNK